MATKKNAKGIPIPTTTNETQESLDSNNGEASSTSIFPQLSAIRDKGREEV